MGVHSKKQLASWGAQGLGSSLPTLAKEQEWKPKEHPTTDSIVRALTYGLPLGKLNKSRVQKHDRSVSIVPTKSKKKRSMLTNARREALLEVFNAFDVDGGGSIDADEFRAPHHGTL